MENQKNEFDDIILEKNTQSEKMKKILLRIVALVILFLVVMIIMKLVNSSSDEKLQNQSILPSEPITTQENHDDNSFENMPITDNNIAEDQFEALRKQFQDEQNASENEANSSNNLHSIMPEQEQKPVATKQIAEADTAKQEVKQIKIKKEKDFVKLKEQNANDLFKNVNAKPIHPNGLASGIYVQIFSVSNLDQKSKELALVKQKGYEYKLYKTTLGGKEITKVLIGPFEKANIANELAKIRKDITKDAFSFTLK
ncbi:SPOR domain-containing protein [Campylobacter hepaticus]|uniref:SPOR domain-containing protein n=1 Tax=Campylobacter hepaticus TaxID=1813019 RepID=UPI0029B67DA3|nr:SPOR domain-containing protein [Campylobacter hepaticus]MDX2331082.1 SPOR domain-containing protein [Campylobacter hepaticus]MDX2371593.1 SPOR domain-containing protein [Campylobacter hepaticus]MDX2396947.1 SPOR domain-containing protein [Campylobacter hepaticus]MDX5508751.1 SPOR domain-containing protein [Campylobacter hepaticus]